VTEVLNTANATYRVGNAAGAAEGDSAEGANAESADPTNGRTCKIPAERSGPHVEPEAAQLIPADEA
jgi:hypothetical protein